MWPFRRRRVAEPSPEALDARREAAAELQQALKRGSEVTRLADSLRKTLLKNHLSEAMEHLILTRSTHHEPGK